MELVYNWTEMIDAVGLEFRNGKFLTWLIPEHKDRFSLDTFHNKLKEIIENNKRKENYIWLSSDKSVSKTIYKIFEEMGITEYDYRWNYGRVTIGISPDRVIWTHSDTKASSGEPYEVIFGKPFEVE